MERLTKPLRLHRGDRIPADTHFVVDPAFVVDPLQSYSALYAPEGVGDVRFGPGCSITSEWSSYPTRAYRPDPMAFHCGVELRGANEGIDLENLAIRGLPGTGVSAQRGGVVGLRWVNGRVSRCSVGIAADWPQAPRRPHSDWTVRGLVARDTWGYDTDTSAQTDPDGRPDYHSGGRSVRYPGGWVGANLMNADGLLHSDLDDLDLTGESHTALKLVAPRHVRIRRGVLGSLWLGPTQQPWPPLFLPNYSDPTPSRDVVVEGVTIDPRLHSAGAGQTRPGNTVQCSGPTPAGEPFRFTGCTIYVPDVGTLWQTPTPRPFRFAAIQAYYGCELYLDGNTFVVRGDPAKPLRDDEIIHLGAAGDVNAGKVNADWKTRNKIVYLPDESGRYVPERVVA